MEKEQARQKQVYDKKVRNRVLQEGDDLWTKIPTDNKWKKATVTRTKSAHSYDVKFEDGTIKRRHIDQTKAVPQATSENENDVKGPKAISQATSENENNVKGPLNMNIPDHESKEEGSPPAADPRPSRNRRLPERLHYHRLGGEEGRCNDLAGLSSTQLKSRRS